MSENIFKQTRLKTGMTQKETAEWLDIPLRTWENWERGISKPPKYVEKLIIDKLLKKEGQ